MWARLSTTSHLLLNVRCVLVFPRFFSTKKKAFLSACPALPPSRHALEQKKVRRSPPPPPGPCPPPPLPPLPSHLKKIFFSAFGADVLCVPQGHVQGVSGLFTLNSMSL